MTEVSTTELYELYRDTITHGTSKILDLSDEEIEWNLFEEFDVGVHSFLHDDSLAKLHRAGLIDDVMLDISRQIRKLWLVLQMRSWSIDEVKTRMEWRDLLKLCDQLMRMSDR